MQQLYRLYTYIIEGFSSFNRNCLKSILLQVGSELEDMKKAGLKKEDAQNRSPWRAGTMRNCLTHASMEK